MVKQCLIPTSGIKEVNEGPTTQWPALARALLQLRDSKEQSLTMEQAAQLVQEKTSGSRPPGLSLKPLPMPAPTQRRGSHTDSQTADFVTFIYLLSCLGNSHYCDFYL